MLATAVHNAMLDAFAAAVDAVSLHSADPGTSGSSEVSVAPAVVSWAPAANGAVASAGDISFDVPACTVTHVGYLADGRPVGGRPLDYPQPFSTPGVYTIPAGGLVEVLS